MLKVKQQEDLSDPLAREPDLSPSSSTSRQPSSQSLSLGGTSMGVEAIQQSMQQQMQQMQQQMQLMQQSQSSESRLKLQIESLKHLKRQQEQLKTQQKNLEDQLRILNDPTSHESQQLQQQHALLKQLQEKCQHQQVLLERSLQLSNASASGNVDQNPEPSNFPVPNSMSMPESVNLNELTKSQSVRRPQKGGKGKRQGKGGKSLKLPNVASEKPRSTSSSIQEQAGKRSSSEQMVANVSMDDFVGTEGTSLVYSMTPAEVGKHLESLKKRVSLSPTEVTEKCMPLAQQMIEDQYGWVFRDAVDPVALGLPDYFEVVKNPIHLSLVKENLEKSFYSEIEDFARDMKLVFENAILYNGETSEVGGLAQMMLQRFDEGYRSLRQGT